MSRFEAEPGALSLLSLRPSTAEAPRRSSIEADASVSRSSRLPPPSITASLSLGSGWASARAGNSQDQAPHLSAIGRARVRGSGATVRSEPSGSLTSAPAFVGATGGTWVPRRQCGKLGELRFQPDRAVALKAGENNGAVSGARWGGEDQMNRVAAAPKHSGRFGRKSREPSGTSGGVGEEKRPDTRERFYEVSVEALKALRPCVRCFEALMRHFRGPRAVEMHTSWNSAAAAEDPHVALFVRRWESLDKDLGRYTPRGFVGSFTPRPFRPALAEYAVKAAIQDPKFWGLGWAQIPLAR
ncbi:unnamed protein product [Hapterophycus canaliculatus]